MLKFHFIEITYALNHLAAVGETFVNDRECLLKEEGGEEMAPPSLSFFLTTPQSLSIILLQGMRGVWLLSKLLVGVVTPPIINMVGVDHAYYSKWRPLAPWRMCQAKA